MQAALARSDSGYRRALALCVDLTGSCRWSARKKTLKAAPFQTAAARASCHPRCCEREHVPIPQRPRVRADAAAARAAICVVLQQLREAASQRARQSSAAEHRSPSAVESRLACCLVRCLPWIVGLPHLKPTPTPHPASPPQRMPSAQLPPDRI